MTVRSYHIPYHTAALNKFLWRNYNVSTLCLNVRRIISRLCFFVPCNQNHQHIWLDCTLHQESSAGLEYALQPESSAQVVLSIRRNQNHQQIVLRHTLQQESSEHLASVYLAARIISTLCLNITCNQGLQHIFLEYTLRSRSSANCA